MKFIKTLFPRGLAGLLLCIAFIEQTHFNRVHAAEKPLPFSRIVAFGGELSDAGNVYQIFGFPPQPYQDGRFSNGPVAVEHLANELNLAMPEASRSGGSNYAISGAPLIGSNVMARFGMGFNPDNVSKQINTMLKAEELAGEELIVIIGGANDQYVEGNGLSGNEGVKTANALGDYVNQLADAGGRYFLLSNLFLSGLRPAVKNQPQGSQQRMENWQEDFHDQLETVVSELQARSDITVLFFDWVGWHESWAAEAKANGTQLTRLACGQCNLGTPTGSASQSVVPDPQNYVFWDGLRFTTAYHQHLGCLYTVHFLPGFK